MRRQQPLSEAPLVQLNRWQLTGVLLGLGLIVVIVFFAGVVVGRQSTAPLPPELARIASAPPTGPSEGRHAGKKGKLYDVRPGTRAIDGELARPVARVVPRDPTEAARIETHRQLRRSRGGGIAGAAGAAGRVAPSAHTPSAPVVADPGASRDGAFALQVSVFETRAPAAEVARELQEAQAPALLRKVEASGHVYWRVEVGRFTSAAEAASFQRGFERDSGYSTVIVPTP